MVTRKRIFEIIEIGTPDDHVSRTYDFFNIFSIVSNLFVSILLTFDDIKAAYGPILLTVEAVTVAFFASDYFLRLITARYLYPKKATELRAIGKYIPSFIYTQVNYNNSHLIQI